MYQYGHSQDGTQKGYVNYTLTGTGKLLILIGTPQLFQLSTLPGGSQVSLAYPGLDQYMRTGLNMTTLLAFSRCLDY